MRARTLSGGAEVDRAERPLDTGRSEPLLRALDLARQGSEGFRRSDEQPERTLTQPSGWLANRGHLTETPAQGLKARTQSVTNHIDHCRAEHVMARATSGGLPVMVERGTVVRMVGAGCRVVVACVLCLLASSSMADDAARANQLLVEAVALVRAAELEPAAEEKFVLLRQAHDNLVEIVERYPTTDLAVKLATGQWVGSISLAAVREAMNRARPANPQKPGEPVQVWRLGSGVAAVAIRSRGAQALIVARDGVAALHDIETGELLRTWQHPGGLSNAALTRQRTGGASTVAVSPHGHRVLTAGRDGIVEMRDIETGQLLHRWQHERAVAAVALSRNGRSALVGVGPEALLIDVDELRIRHTWRGKSPVTTVSYAPDGQRILAGFADGRAVLGEAGTGRVLHTWKHPGSGGGGVMSAAFSPDGRRVLTGAANRTAVLRDTATGQTLRKWQVGAYRTTSVALSRDGRWVLTGDEGYEVELHDVETGETVRKWRYDASAEAVAFSPDGNRAVMGFADGVVIVCEIRMPERGRSFARTVLTQDGGCW